MKINNLYNFKNPVKNFLDIDGLKFADDIGTWGIEKLCWTKPFNFRVKKQGDKYRTIKMPNIINFKKAYLHFNDMPRFYNIHGLDLKHKRLVADLLTGDFKSGEYEKHLEKDFEKLCIYDNLMRVDIKEYYGRIYTHYIEFHDHKENFLSNMNLGATNGLIMGNYISLYFAEANLKSISNDIEKEINDSGLDCEFTYFSDDFYFFCNNKDNEKIIKIFDNVLEKYELERNDEKKELWTYETFNSYNLITRYWKKLIAHCNTKYKEEDNNNNMYFINQLVYRISKLENNKLKKVFIDNFFKTKYFQERNLDKYQIHNYDYHQLCFIFKFSPEAMLYAINKFSTMCDFDKHKLHKFFKIRYKEILQEPFNDEQLYFYYAIKVLNYEDIIVEEKAAVLKSNNQLLISYYLQDGIFESEDINKLKEFNEEKYWFQNYHLILYSEDLLSNIDESINRYLIPIYAKKEAQIKTYFNFYKENLEARKPIIREISGVYREIKDYLTAKFTESKNTNEDSIEVAEEFELLDNDSDEMFNE